MRYNLHKNDIRIKMCHYKSINMKDCCNGRNEGQKCVKYIENKWQNMSFHIRSYLNVNILYSPIEKYKSRKCIKNDPPICCLKET
jgi:hypothetical protein